MALEQEGSAYCSKATYSSRSNVACLTKADLTTQARKRTPLSTCSQTTPTDLQTQRFVPTQSGFIRNTGEVLDIPSNKSSWMSLQKRNPSAQQVESWPVHFALHLRATPESAAGNQGFLITIIAWPKVPHLAKESWSDLPPPRKPSTDPLSPLLYKKWVLPVNDLSFRFRRERDYVQLLKVSRETTVLIKCPLLSFSN